MYKCETCIHSKFDKVWGEYKCIKYARRITIEELLSNACTNYKKDSNKGEKHDTSDDNSN